MEEGRKYSKYGWVVVVSVFFILFFIMGPASCFSILYLTLKERLDSSATETGWLLGLQCILKFGLSEFQWNLLYSLEASYSPQRRRENFLATKI